MEQKLAMWTGLDVTPGSGCGYIFKGDLNDEEWLVEVKSTRQKELVFDTAWFTKAAAQAKDKNKEFFAVLFGWDDRPDDFNGSSILFAAVPEELCDIEPKDPHISCGKAVTITEFLETLKNNEALILQGESVTIKIMTLDTYLEKCLDQS